MQIPPWGPLAEVFMLDSGWHQGSSLLGQSSGQLRVLSVIPSGEAEDLHALWQACAALQTQGYPVMILDGLESETDQAPGLEDVLQGCSSTALPAHLTQPHAIASLPAARGLQELADWAQASGQPPLGQLYRHFRNHALLVVLAPAPLLGAVCKGVQQAPWLLVPTKRHSVVACYRALKQVFMDTGVMPQLLALRPAHTGLDPLLKSIAQCAHHHLHVEPLAQQIDPEHPRQLQRWALQCLEQGQVITAPEPAMLPASLFAPCATPSPAWNH